MVQATHLDLQKRGSEKSSFNLHAWALRRNTLVGSRARNVGETTETGKIPAGETWVKNTSEDVNLQWQNINLEWKKTKFYENGIDDNGSEVLGVQNARKASDGEKRDGKRMV